MKQVYLDNAATTAVRSEVVERMTEVLKHNFGNASSTHSFGRSSKALLEQCRKNIASYFNATASEIVFTSGGTEADNLALRCAVRDLGVTEIISSKILPGPVILLPMRWCSQELKVDDPTHFVPLL